MPLTVTDLLQTTLVRSFSFVLQAHRTLLLSVLVVTECCIPCLLCSPSSLERSFVLSRPQEVCLDRPLVSSVFVFGYTFLPLLTDGVCCVTTLGRVQRLHLREAVLTGECLIEKCSISFDLRATFPQLRLPGLGLDSLDFFSSGYPVFRSIPSGLCFEQKRPCSFE